jgi:hypothetical protein
MIELRATDFKPSAFAIESLLLPLAKREGAHG